jgi:hypothetical protein
MFFVYFGYFLLRLPGNGFQGNYMLVEKFENEDAHMEVEQGLRM